VGRYCLAPFVASVRPKNGERVSTCRERGQQQRGGRKEGEKDKGRIELAIFQKIAKDLRQREKQIIGSQTRRRIAREMPDRWTLIGVVMLTGETIRGEKGLTRFACISTEANCRPASGGVRDTHLARWAKRRRVKKNWNRECLRGRGPRPASFRKEDLVWRSAKR